MELPRLEPLWQKYRDRGLSIVALEAFRDTDTAVKFIEEKGLTFHFLENGEENDVVGGTFGVRGFPTTFIIDREGRIMYFHLGFNEGDEAEIEREILSLMGS